MLRLLILTVFLSMIGATGRADSEYSESERSHWSFLPRADVRIPEVFDRSLSSRVRTPVDAFIFRRLQEAGLRPAPAASPEQLLRRLTFGLTGLPPSPTQLEAWRTSKPEASVAELVDRLLSSPRYGEQWGQHWLDVVRYAESEGFEYDRPIHGAWRFRDYVIRAFNSDKPFDQFVTEQLAGDELSEESDEGWTAAGFHRLGPVRRNAGNAAVSFSRNEVLTERTNIIGAAFLGVTVGCARCHDHMFDPFRQRDYYSLQAFLAGTFEHEVHLAPKSKIADHSRRTARIQKQIDLIKEALDRQITQGRENALREQLSALSQQLPPPLPGIATVHEQPEVRTTIQLLLRGDPDLPLEEVTPQFLRVLLPAGTPDLPKNIAKPKSRLASWIVAAENPLTARVIANRVWQYHFGRGLVPTANDFGANGEPPSHPELLDFLANYLVEHDWSMKALHRLILLSETYRQSSAPDNRARAEQFDPDGELLWRYPRHRLAAHEIRDAMLSAAGLLNLKTGGPSVMVPVESDLVELLYKPSQWEVEQDPVEHHRRSIYLVAKRNLRLPFMEVFDQPTLQISCPQRESSTHAPQALALLNGSLSNELASALGRRLVDEAGSKPSDQIRHGFWLTIGREPSQREFELAQRFLAENPISEFALALFNLNAFIYVD